MIGSEVSEPPPYLVVQLRRSLQQARVQIEDVAGIRLAAWRTAEQQRDFAIRLRVLREIVVNQQRVAARVAEELAHRRRRVRADVEHRRRIRRRRRDDDRVAHRVGFFERAHDLRDRRLLLADRVVDADDAGVFLVEDRVDRDGGLAGLAVADDQLALAAADRHHAVDRLEAGLHRLAHRLAIDDAGRDALDRRGLLGQDRALAVDRLAERVDDAAEHLFADRHRDDAAGALDRIAFLDLRCTRRAAPCRRCPLRGSARCRTRRAGIRASRPPWRAGSRARARCRRRATPPCRLPPRRPQRAKLPICSRMILEISSALMLIV